jgi:hypothetical protein
MNIRRFRAPYERGATYAEIADSGQDGSPGRTGGTP